MERRIFEKIIEGILCKGWNLYLSKNNYNEFYKFLNNIFIIKVQNSFLILMRSALLEYL